MGHLFPNPMATFKILTYSTLFQITPLFLIIGNKKIPIELFRLMPSTLVSKEMAKPELSKVRQV
jgi:hypothetical protein